MLKELFYYIEFYGKRSYRNSLRCQVFKKPNADRNFVRCQVHETKR